MSTETFLFTAEESGLLDDPVRAIDAFIGRTWEIAIRFLFSKRVAEFRSILDANNVHIGYLVEWMNDEEIAACFQNNPGAIIPSSLIDLDESTIDIRIREIRLTARKKHRRQLAKLPKHSSSKKRF